MIILKQFVSGKGDENTPIRSQTIFELPGVLQCFYFIEGFKHSDKKRMWKNKKALKLSQTRAIQVPLIILPYCVSACMIPLRIFPNSKDGLKMLK